MLTKEYVWNTNKPTEENSASEDDDLWMQFIITEEGTFSFLGEFSWPKKNYTNKKYTHMSLYPVSLSARGKN